MKTIKLLALSAVLVCTLSLISGCACCGKSSAQQADCGMKCCAEGKTNCATCPTCSAKK